MVRSVQLSSLPHLPSAATSLAFLERTPPAAVPCWDYRCARRFKIKVAFPGFCTQQRHFSNRLQFSGSLWPFPFAIPSCLLRASPSPFLSPASNAHTACMRPRSSQSRKCTHPCSSHDIPPDLSSFLLRTATRRAFTRLRGRRDALTLTPSPTPSLRLRLELTLTLDADADDL